MSAEADLMHSFPKDVFVFVLIDVFALIVRFDGKLHLLHCPLLGVQLLQVLSSSRNRHATLIMQKPQQNLDKFTYLNSRQPDLYF